MSPRILVIEDDSTSRMMLARGLQRQGFEVEVSADAIEAQATIQARGPAVFEGVVVDLRMPRMDGLEFITWLEGFDPSLGCLLLTAQQDDAMRDHRDHPTLLFRMQKPAGFPLLGEALRKVIDFTRARRTEKPNAA